MESIVDVEIKITYWIFVSIGCKQYGVLPSIFWIIGYSKQQKFVILPPKGPQLQHDNFSAGQNYIIIILNYLVKKKHYLPQVLHQDI